MNCSQFLYSIIDVPILRAAAKLRQPLEAKACSSSHRAALQHIVPVPPLSHVGLGAQTVTAGRGEPSWDGQPWTPLGMHGASKRMWRPAFTDTQFPLCTVSRCPNGQVLNLDGRTAKNEVQHRDAYVASGCSGLPPTATLPGTTRLPGSWEGSKANEMPETYRHEGMEVRVR